MFLDPFIFTPPKPDALTRAVESYQRVAAVRFCHHARIAEDPDAAPLRATGDLLEPDSKQLHAEVRALRHLTAIQRTLREIGGPLFNPDSPIPPRERFSIVERRMDAIEEALGELDEDPDAPIRILSDDPADAPGDFELYRTLPGEDFYHPPQIGDLLEAVNLAQRVFAARGELLDRRRLRLCPRDFLLEIQALRDLTAVVRTLRRMSAHRLPERQTHEDFQKEFTPEPEAAARASTPVQDCVASAEADTDLDNSPHGSSESVESVKSVDDSSSSGLVNPVQADLRTRPVPRVPEIRRIAPRRNAANPTSEPEVVPNSPVSPQVRHGVSSRRSPSAKPEAGSEAGQDPSHRSDSPRRSCDSSSSQISNLKSEIHPPSRSSSSESVQSVKSVDGSPSPSDSLEQEDDLGPWGIWETPPPEAVDESSPEFLADMKRYGYIAAWRRAAARLAHAPPPDPPESGNPILNDSDPEPDSPP